MKPPTPHADTPNADAPRANTDLRSFGRKRGRKLSDRQRWLMQDILPKVSVDPIRLAAGGADALPTPLWLEIGFGGGEHLIWQAGHNPDVMMIGCEPFEDGIVKVLSAIEDHRLPNIRVFPNDARELLRALPPGTVDRAFILFPDPWPKKRHVKRRLVSRPTLRLLAHAMKPGAELRLATDIADYARTMLGALRGVPDFCWCAASPEDWRQRPDDWPQTRYEAKALKEGRKPYFFRIKRL